MEKTIEIRDLNYSISSASFSFEHFSVTFKEKTMTWILGSVGSGKSTLFDILTGRIHTKNVYQNGILCSNYGDRNWGIITNDDFCVSEDTVKNIFLHWLEVHDVDNASKKLAQFIKDWGIERFMNKKATCLSSGEKQCFRFFKIAILDPSCYIIDSAFTMIDFFMKKKIMEYLKKEAHQFHKIVIYFSIDSSDSVYSDRIILLKQGKIMVDQKKKEILENEKIFKTNHVTFPFMADLSLKLRYYGVIDHLELDMNHMVNEIWK